MTLPASSLPPTTGSSSPRSPEPRIRSRLAGLQRLQSPLSHRHHLTSIPLTTPHLWICLSQTHSHRPFFAAWIIFRRAAPVPSTPYTLLSSSPSILPTLPCISVSLSGHRRLSTIFSTQTNISSPPLTHFSYFSITIAPTSPPPSSPPYYLP